MAGNVVRSGGEVKEDVKEGRESVGSVKSEAKENKNCLTVKIIVLNICS
jgi:hypothetical protein